MKTRIAFGLQSLTATAAALLGLFFSPLLLAQSAPVAAPSAEQAQPAPSASGAIARQTYRSAFEDYQPYTDEKMLSWKNANDVTAQIGGWRAYAKEASEPAPGADSSAVEPKAQP